jgi:hypothetical protein
MVSHEGVGMKRAVFFLKRLAQPVKIGLVIFLAEKAGLAVMTPLHDVQGNPIKVDAGASGHVTIISKTIRAWPL